MAANKDVPCPRGRHGSGLDPDDSPSLFCSYIDGPIRSLLTTDKEGEVLFSVGNRVFFQPIGEQGGSDPLHTPPHGGTHGSCSRLCGSGEVCMAGRQTHNAGNARNTFSTGREVHPSSCMGLDVSSSSSFVFFYPPLVLCEVPEGNVVTELCVAIAWRPHFLGEGVVREATRMVFMGAADTLFCFSLPPASVRRREKRAATLRTTACADWRSTSGTHRRRQGHVWNEPPSRCSMNVAPPIARKIASFHGDRIIKIRHVERSLEDKDGSWAALEAPREEDTARDKNEGPSPIWAFLIYTASASVYCVHGIQTDSPSSGVAAESVHPAVIWRCTASPLVRGPSFLGVTLAVDGSVIPPLPGVPPSCASSSLSSLHVFSGTYAGSIVEWCCPLPPISNAMTLHAAADTLSHQNHYRVSTIPAHMASCAIFSVQVLTAYEIAEEGTGNHEMEHFFHKEHPHPASKDPHKSGTKAEGQHLDPMLAVERGIEITEEPSGVHFMLDEEQADVEEGSRTKAGIKKGRFPPDTERGSPWHDGKAVEQRGVEHEEREGTPACLTEVCLSSPSAVMTGTPSEISEIRSQETETANPISTHAITADLLLLRHTVATCSDDRTAAVYRRRVWRSLFPYQGKEAPENPTDGEKNKISSEVASFTRLTPNSSTRKRGDRDEASEGEPSGSVWETWECLWRGGGASFSTRRIFEVCLWEDARESDALLSFFRSPLPYSHPLSPPHQPQEKSDFVSTSCRTTRSSMTNEMACGAAISTMAPFPFTTSSMILVGIASEDGSVQLWQVRDEGGRRKEENRSIATARPPNPLSSSSCLMWHTSGQHNGNGATRIVFGHHGLDVSTPVSSCCGGGNDHTSLVPFTMDARAHTVACQEVHDPLDSRAALDEGGSPLRSCIGGLLFLVSGGFDGSVMARAIPSSFYAPFTGRHRRVRERPLPFTEEQNGKSTIERSSQKEEVKENEKVDLPCGAPQGSSSSLSCSSSAAPFFPYRIRVVEGTKEVETGKRMITGGAEEKKKKEKKKKDVVRCVMATAELHILVCTEERFYVFLPPLNAENDVEVERTTRNRGVSRACGDPHEARLPPSRTEHRSSCGGEEPHDAREGHEACSTSEPLSSSPFSSSEASLPVWAGSLSWEAILRSTHGIVSPSTISRSLRHTEMEPMERGDGERVQPSSWPCVREKSSSGLSLLRATTATSCYWLMQDMGPFSLPHAAMGKDEFNSSTPALLLPETEKNAAVMVFCGVVGTAAGEMILIPYITRKTTEASTTRPIFSTTTTTDPFEILSDPSTASQTKETKPGKHALLLSALSLPPPVQCTALVSYQKCMRVERVLHAPDYIVTNHVGGHIIVAHLVWEPKTCNTQDGKMKEEEGKRFLSCTGVGSLSPIPTEDSHPAFRGSSIGVPGRESRGSCSLHIVGIFSHGPGVQLTAMCAWRWNHPATRHHPYSSSSLPLPLWEDKDKKKGGAANQKGKERDDRHPAVLPYDPRRCTNCQDDTVPHRTPLPFSVSSPEWTGAEGRRQVVPAVLCIAVGNKEGEVELLTMPLPGSSPLSSSSSCSSFQRASAGGTPSFVSKAAPATPIPEETRTPPTLLSSAFQMLLFQRGEGIATLFPLFPSDTTRGSFALLTSSSGPRQPLSSWDESEVGWLLATTSQGGYHVLPLTLPSVLSSPSHTVASSTITVPTMTPSSAPSQRSSTECTPPPPATPFNSPLVRTTSAPHAHPKQPVASTTASEEITIQEEVAIPDGPCHGVEISFPKKGTLPRGVKRGREPENRRSGTTRMRRGSVPLCPHPLFLRHPVSTVLWACENVWVTISGTVASIWRREIEERRAFHHSISLTVRGTPSADETERGEETRRSKKEVRDPPMPPTTTIHHKREAQEEKGEGTDTYKARWNAGDVGHFLSSCTPVSSCVASFPVHSLWSTVCDVPGVKAPRLLHAQLGCRLELAHFSPVCSTSFVEPRLSIPDRGEGEEEEKRRRGVALTPFQRAAHRRKVLAPWKEQWGVAMVHCSDGEHVEIHLTPIQRKQHRTTLSFAVEDEEEADTAFDATHATSNVGGCASLASASSSSLCSPPPIRLTSLFGGDDSHPLGRRIALSFHAAILLRGASFPGKDFNSCCALWEVPSLLSLFIMSTPASFSSSPCIREVGSGETSMYCSQATKKYDRTSKGTTSVVGTLFFAGSEEGAVLVCRLVSPEGLSHRPPPVGGYDVGTPSSEGEERNPDEESSPTSRRKATTPTIHGRSSGEVENMAPHLQDPLPSPVLSLSSLRGPHTSNINSMCSLPPHWCSWHTTVPVHSRSSEISTSAFTALGELDGNATGGPRHASSTAFERESVQRWWWFHRVISVGGSSTITVWGSCGTMRSRRKMKNHTVLEVEEVEEETPSMGAWAVEAVLSPFLPSTSLPPPVTRSTLMGSCSSVPLAGAPERSTTKTTAGVASKGMEMPRFLSVSPLCSLYCIPSSSCGGDGLPLSGLPGYECALRPAPTRAKTRAMASTNDAAGVATPAENTMAFSVVEETQIMEKDGEKEGYPNVPSSFYASSYWNRKDWIIVGSSDAIVRCYVVEGTSFSAFSSVFPVKQEDTYGSLLQQQLGGANSEAGNAPPLPPLFSFPLCHPPQLCQIHEVGHLTLDPSSRRPVWCVAPMDEIVVIREEKIGSRSEKEMQRDDATSPLITSSCSFFSCASLSTKRKRKTVTQEQCLVAGDGAGRVFVVACSVHLPMTRGREEEEPGAKPEIDALSLSSSSREVRMRVVTSLRIESCSVNAITTNLYAYSPVFSIAASRGATWSTDMAHPHKTAVKVEEANQTKREAITMRKEITIAAITDSGTVHLLAFCASFSDEDASWFPTLATSKCHAPCSKKEGNAGDEKTTPITVEHRTCYGRRMGTISPLTRIAIGMTAGRGISWGRLHFRCPWNSATEEEEEDLVAVCEERVVRLRVRRGAPPAGGVDVTCSSSLSCPSRRMAMPRRSTRTNGSPCPPGVPADPSTCSASTMGREEVCLSVIRQHRLNVRGLSGMLSIPTKRAAPVVHVKPEEAMMEKKEVQGDSTREEHYHHGNTKVHHHDEEGSTEPHRYRVVLVGQGMEILEC